MEGYFYVFFKTILSYIKRVKKKHKWKFIKFILLKAPGKKFNFFSLFLILLQTKEEWHKTECIEIFYIFL